MPAFTVVVRRLAEAAAAQPLSLAAESGINIGQYLFYSIGKLDD